MKKLERENAVRAEAQRRLAAKEAAKASREQAIAREKERYSQLTEEERLAEDKEAAAKLAARREAGAAANIKRKEQLLWDQQHPFAARIRSDAANTIGSRRHYHRHGTPTWKEELQNIQLKGDRHAKTPEEFAELRKVYIILATLNIEPHPLTRRAITDITPAEIDAVKVLIA